MGWLDHSTNNIILDAVLTDYGRQKLSSLGVATASAESALISQYAFGDDEVDYTLVKKYGRTVGKEKIEKNTPIFEALTNPSIALKYRLVGRENAGTTMSMLYMPTLEASPTAVSLVRSGNTNNTSQIVTVSLKYKNSTSVPPEVIQQQFSIKVSDRFFNITGGGSGVIETKTLESGLDPNRTATYTLTPLTQATTNGSTTTTQSFSFTVSVVSTIDSTTLSVYGKQSAANTSERTINSYITVIGKRHGCTLDIPITLRATL